MRLTGSKVAGMGCLLAVIIVSAPFNAQAEEEIDPCKQASKLAELIMLARQLKLPLSEALELDAVKNSKLAKGLVIAAYDQPSFRSMELQSDSVRNFSDQAYLACLKANQNN